MNRPAPRRQLQLKRLHHPVALARRLVVEEVAGRGGRPGDGERREAPLVLRVEVVPERVLGLFGADYRDPRALRPLVDAPRTRPPLDGLIEYNRAVGGDTLAA